MFIRTFIHGLVLLLFAVMLTGCNTARPVEHVRDRANFHFDRGEYSRAAEEYAEITARYPGDWRAQYRLGLSFMEEGQLNGARRALEIAHTHRPGNMDIVRALAEVMYQQDDEQHLFAFLKDRAETTQSVAAYLMLARYSRLTGDPDSAQVALRTAISLDEGRSAEPYLQAAIFHEELGNTEEAVRRLRQAYGINPNDQRVRQKLRELGEVPGPTIGLPPGR